MSTWTDKPIEERRAIVARRDPVKVRESDRARYQRDRTKRIAAMKRYAKTKRDPEKRAANVAVGNAVRDGRLKKEPCEVCEEVRVEAHHADYSKPLEVEWLCSVHHGAKHRTF